MRLAPFSFSQFPRELILNLKMIATAGEALFAVIDVFAMDDVAHLIVDFDFGAKKNVPGGAGDG